MPTCDVARCGRRAVVEVRFAFGLSFYRYCRWHGYRYSELRWPGWWVAESREIP